MDTTLITTLASNLSELGFRVRSGLKQSEIENINDAFGAKMPQDLQHMLTVSVPVVYPGMPSLFTDWHRNPDQIAKASKARILNGLKFDVTAGNYWCDAFGKRPKELEDAIVQAQEIVAGWPTLFPVYGHRYIPTAFPSGHPPVISFLQFVDVIVYGNNLYDYFINEFKLPLKPVSKDEVLVEDLPYWGPSFNADDD